MTRSRRDPSGYEVGYGKPPAATRFQPGHSGNPRGRPKGSRSVRDILEAVLQKRVAVTVNGRTRKVAVIEVAMNRLANNAMRSDLQALKFLLTLADRLEAAGGATPDLGAMLAGDKAILRQYLGTELTAGPERQTEPPAVDLSEPLPLGRRGSPADEG